MGGLACLLSTRMCRTLWLRGGFDYFSFGGAYDRDSMEVYCNPQKWDEQVVPNLCNAYEPRPHSNSTSHAYYALCRIRLRGGRERELTMNGSDSSSLNFNPFPLA